jgi:hypothetical protein
MALPINRAMDEIVLSGRVADVSATTAGYVTSPCKGKIRRAYSVIEGTVDGTAVISFAIDGATALTDTLSIADTSTAGTVDSVEFSQAEGTLGRVLEGSAISFTPSGAGSAAVVGNFFVVIEKA